ncbi:MAG: YtxH domain-containing protein [Deinococcales bacterium]|nr:YtxH domain-containing protein [Chitinophagaceae bacterium]
MLNNQKFLGGLLIGAAAGAAITIFLNSDKGKKVIADAKARFSNLNIEFDSLLAKSKFFLDEMEAKISEA